MARAVTTDGTRVEAEPVRRLGARDGASAERERATAERTGEIVVVSFGPADAVQQIRQSLAMGADRGMLVECDETKIDSWVVARGLAALVEKEKPDLVVMGKQSADGESSAVGPFLAELLGWPMSTGTMKIVVSDGKLEVTREADGGVIIARITPPAVITVTDRIVTPEAVKNGVSPADHKYPESDTGRYASLKGIMNARKKPLETVALGSLGIDANATSAWSELAKPPSRSGSTTYVENVQELVEKLHNEAKVI